MPWIYGLTGLLVGAILGIIIARLKTPQYKKHRQIQKELDKTRFELEQQRQELTDHFAQTAELLDILGKDYTKLYQHMANASSEFLPNIPEQDNPFPKKAAKEEESEESKGNIETQPKDYAKGATGLLTPEEKEIVQPDEAVKS